MDTLIPFIQTTVKMESLDTLTIPWRHPSVLRKPMSVTVSMMPSIPCKSSSLCSMFCYAFSSIHDQLWNFREHDVIHLQSWPDSFVDWRLEVWLSVASNQSCLVCHHLCWQNCSSVSTDYLVGLIFSEKRCSTKSIEMLPFLTKSCLNLRTKWNSWKGFPRKMMKSKKSSLSCCWKNDFIREIESNFINVFFHWPSLLTPLFLRFFISFPRYNFRHYFTYRWGWTKQLDFHSLKNSSNNSKRFSRHVMPFCVKENFMDS